MFRKCIFSLIAIGQSVFSFTLINQTDREKVMTIEEAYRPSSNKPGNLAAPISLGYKPQKVKMDAHSRIDIRLRESCPTLLVSVITNQGKKKQTVTTFYDAYEVNGSESLFTEDWGLVIHKPFESKVSLLDPDHQFKRYLAEQDRKRGYGIKALKPNLLAKVVSMEELPDELKK